MKFNGPQQGIREETLFFQCLQGKSWLLRVLNLCTSTLESSEVYVNEIVVPLRRNRPSSIRPRKGHFKPCLVVPPQS